MATLVDFSDDTKGLSALEIALHNMQLADEMLDLQLMIGSCMGWLEACPPGKTLADLETELRRLGLNTHIYAKKPVLDAEAFSLRPYRGTGPCTHEAVFSCRPAARARAEVLEHWSDPDGNIRALATAGMRVLLEDSKQAAAAPPPAGVGGSTLEVLGPTRRGQISLVSSNLVLLRLKHLTGKQLLAEAEKDVLRRTGRAPTLMLCAIAPGGRPVMALALDGAIVVPYGFIFSAHTGDGDCTVVDLGRS